MTRKITSHSIVLDPRPRKQQHNMKERITPFKDRVPEEDVDQKTKTHSDGIMKKIVLRKS